MNSTNPYRSPEEYTYPHDDTEYEYVGFWMRFLALLIDTLIVIVIFLPVQLALGIDPSDPVTNSSFSTFDLIANILVTIAYIFFWVKYAGTPGKLILKMKVLDAETGNPLTISQAVLRYVGYLVSGLMLCIGFIWVAFDAKKQGWHDKIAKTVVVKEV